MLWLLMSCQDKTTFVIDGANTIWIAPDEPAYIRLAVQDLISDVEKITGKQMVIVENPSELKEQSLVIGTINNPTVAAFLPSERLQTMQGKWEQYTLLHLDTHQNLKQLLLIAGSNPRGTMFGIYHFLEHQLGVDPLYFWTDSELQKREKIDLSKLNITSSVPDFKFRGWFINDEDLLTEWKEGGGKRTIDYPYYGQVVAPEVIERVAEAAVRLRYNLIIPASFVDIRNPAEAYLVEASSKRGLYVSMHHVEPVGVSAFGYQNYWKEKGESPLFSFYSEPEKLEQTWRDYIQRWSKYSDVVWQIGLRGIADRPMWMADAGVPQSDAERGKIISDAMQLQKQLIQEITGNPNPLMTTTLWAEGAAFHQSGDLTIPDNVMVIFADNSPWLGVAARLL
ncbi:MAG: hypothetical protein HC912_05245 [Saprospiraceae bacterium]|nr:hypothetical protein [Saprospiraceae bacterium]